MAGKTSNELTYVTWSRFAAIIISLFIVALGISFSLGAAQSSLQKDIQINYETLNQHEIRIKVLEEQKEQLNSISDKIDLLIRRDRNKEN